MKRALSALLVMIAICGSASMAAAQESGGVNFFGLFQFGGSGGGTGPIPRTLVNFPSNYAPGNIVVNTRERRLYFVTAPGEALRYGIGVGRDGFRWGGVHRVTAKKEWPAWTPPSQMLRRRPDLPRHMEGGIENPLGARALYLGSTLYRIHGSNEPETIGQAVSSGCFRMVNDDVIDLYNRVRVGATVYVIN
ncbi:MAG: L,D-transpeptidase [Xanthobacteraceae bacterium]|nr:L,D-transpeptidase [Xanthobacteraceae bacterium]